MGARGFVKAVRAPWPESIEEAKKAQAALGERVRVEPFHGRLRCVAGMDASYADGKVFAAACLFAWPGLEHMEDSVAILDCAFPYVPGYLAFREGPALEEAILGLKTAPGLLLFDGQGIAHPRGMGIAAHMGVLLGMPSVGCAKSRLVGEYREPGAKKGSWSALRMPPSRARGGGKSTVGAVLRSREGVRPVFVSPGHLIDIEGSVRIVLASTGRCRLPEPLRRAHIIAQKAKKMCYNS